jgi:hypothetical protein
MSEAYQYALWRVVPDPRRGERLNVGVVLFSPRLRFLGARVQLDEARLRALHPGLDLAAVRAALAQRTAVAAGDAHAGGAIAAMPASDRFGWLVAPASTIVQPGPVHTGLCEDAERTLEALAGTLVGPPR